MIVFVAVASWRCRGMGFLACVAFVTREVLWVVAASLDAALSSFGVGFESLGDVMVYVCGMDRWEEDLDG